jgi:hypothetical protein
VTQFTAKGFSAISSDEVIGELKVTCAHLCF